MTDFNSLLTSAPAAQTTPSIAKITQLYPTFQVYTAAQLAALTPEQLVAVLQNLSKIRDAISSETIKLETQLATIQAQIEQTRTAIRTEFSVDSLEDLQTLAQNLLSQVETQYSTLATLNPSNPS